jgi:hypothetical protein
MVVVSSEGYLVPTVVPSLRRVRTGARVSNRYPDLRRKALRSGGALWRIGRN